MLHVISRASDKSGYKKIFLLCLRGDITSSILNELGTSINSETISVENINNGILGLLKLDSDSGRYDRQTSLSNFSHEMQDKLSDSKVLVIGAGGLGSGLMPILASNGISVHVVDPDYVDLSNLNRQTIYTEKDIGKSKAKTSEGYLKSRNSDIEVESFEVKLNSFDQFKSVYDLIIDCTDNKESRMLIAKHCADANQPYITAAVTGTSGYVYLNKYPKIQPCVHCFFEDFSKEQEKKDKNEQIEVGSCNSVGVYSPAVVLVSAFQANEAIKALSGFGKSGQNELFTFDALTLSSNAIKFEKNHECPICS